MNPEVKKKILDNIRKILLESFNDLTEKQIDSMAEFIYKSSVVLVQEYIKHKQKII